MALIGEIAVNVVAKTGEFQKGTDKARKTVKKFGEEVKKQRQGTRKWTEATKKQERAYKDLGKQATITTSKINRLGSIAKTAFASVATGFIAQQFHQTAVAMNETAKAAERIGISMGNLQRFEAVARKTGVSIDHMQESLKEFQNKLSDARQGTQDAVEAFEMIGVNISNISTQPIEAQFKAILQGLRDVESQADKINLAERIFGGDAGVSMLSLVEKTGGAIDNMMKSATVLSAVQALQLKRYQEVIADLNATVTQTKQAAVVRAAGPVSEVLGGGKLLAQDIGFIGKKLFPMTKGMSQFFSGRPRDPNDPNLPEDRPRIRVSDFGASAIFKHLFLAFREDHARLQARPGGRFGPITDEERMATGPQADAARKRALAEDRFAARHPQVILGGGESRFPGITPPPLAETVVSRMVPRRDFRGVIQRRELMRMREMAPFMDVGAAPGNILATPQFATFPDRGRAVRRPDIADADVILGRLIQNLTDPVITGGGTGILGAGMTRGGPGIAAPGSGPQLPFMLPDFPRPLSVNAGREASMERVKALRIWADSLNALRKIEEHTRPQLNSEPLPVADLD